MPYRLPWRGNNESMSLVARAEAGGLRSSQSNNSLIPYQVQRGQSPLAFSQPMAYDAFHGVQCPRPPHRQASWLRP
ncbi:hypothetical protein DFAR_3650010 [Desulfarculales bacterium]